MLFTYLLLYVVMAAIGWLIGQRKNRPVAGLVWALLLGPLGWLLVALLPEIEAKPKSTLPQYRDQIKVPQD